MGVEDCGGCRVAAVRDKLMEDAAGLYATFGRFDPETEKLFLGLRDGRYTGGRLGNYNDSPEALTASVCAALEHIKEKTDALSGAEPFDRIPALMEAAEIKNDSIVEGEKKP